MMGCAGVSAVTVHYNRPRTTALRSQTWDAIPRSQEGRGLLTRPACASLIAGLGPNIHNCLRTCKSLRVMRFDKVKEGLLGARLVWRSE